MRMTLELSRSISGSGTSWVAIVAISLVVGGIDGGEQPIVQYYKYTIYLVHGITSAG